MSNINFRVLLSLLVPNHPVGAPVVLHRAYEWIDMENSLAELPEYSVGGIRFRTATPSGAAKLTVARAMQRPKAGIHIHLANAYSIALASKDTGVRKALSSGINFPDGKPLQWVSKLRGDAHPLNQVRGPGFLLEAFRESADAGLKHYLLGSTPEVLERLTSNLKEQFPGCQIVGSVSPPFRPMSPEEIESQDQAILRSGADIVWVGLGTPKQDLEAERLAHSVPVVAIAIGAAFDFAAGTRREAPDWISTIGFEWAYRLASEPRRLWKRYLFGNSVFIFSTIRHWNAGTNA